MGSSNQHSTILSFDHGEYLVGQDIRDVLSDARCNEAFWGQLESVSSLGGTNITWRQAFVGLSGYIVMHRQAKIYLRMYFLW